MILGNFCSEAKWGEHAERLERLKLNLREKNRQLKEEVDRKLLDFKVNIRSERKSTTNQHSKRSCTAKEKSVKKGQKIRPY